MEVKIKNFRCIKKKNYIFDNGITLIKGNSGIGKSTIFDAIRWCLYGQIKNIYPFNDKVKETKITLKLGNIKLCRTKPPEMIVVKIGDDLFSGNEAQAIIDKIFSSKNLWMSSSYIVQDERNPLLYFSNQDKMEIIKEFVFGDSNSSPEIYKNKIKEYLKNIEEEILKLSGKSEYQRKIMNEKIKIFQEMEEIEPIKDIQEIKNNIKNYEKKIIQIDRSNEYREKFNTIKTKIEIEDLDLLSKIESYKSIKNKIKEKVYITQEEIEKMKMDNIKYKNCKNFLESIDIKYNKDIVYKKIENLKIKVEKYNLEMSEYEKYCKDYEKYKEYEDIIESCNENLEKLNEYRKLCDNLNINYDNLNIDNLQYNIYKCPCCSSNLILDYDKLLISKNIKCSKEDKIKLSKLHKNIRDLNYEDINIKLQIYQKMKSEMKLQKIEKPKLIDVSYIKEIISKLENISFVNFTDEEDIKNYEYNLEIKKYNNFYIYDNINVKEQRDYINMIKIIEREIIDETDSNIYNIKIEKLEKKIEKYEIFKSWNEKKLEIENIKEELNMTEINYNKFISRKKNIKSIEKIIDETLNFILDSLLGELNEIINDILRKLFDEVCHFEIKLFKKNKDDSLKPHFCINFTLNNCIYTNLNDLSGGEKDRLSIAVTIALSILNSSKIVMLDECMSSLDSDMRDRCIEVAQYYLNDKIVLNICHDTVEGCYDNVLEII